VTKRNVVRVAIGLVAVVAALVTWRFVSRARYRSIVDSDYDYLHSLYASHPSPSHAAIARHFESMVDAPNGRKALIRLDEEHDHVAYDPPRNAVYFIHERDDAGSCLGWAFCNGRRRGEWHAAFPKAVALDEVKATSTGVTIRFHAASDASARAAVTQLGLEPGARYETSVAPPAETLDVESALRHARRV
jgi:hypothetical protein